MSTAALAKGSVCVEVHVVDKKHGQNRMGKHTLGGISWLRQIRIRMQQPTNPLLIQLPFVHFRQHGSVDSEGKKHNSKNKNNKMMMTMMMAAWKKSFQKMENSWNSRPFDWTMWWFGFFCTENHTLKSGILCMKCQMWKHELFH